MLITTARLVKKLLLSAFGRLKQGLLWRLRYLYEQALFQLTYLHRRRLNRTIFVGVTGSAGKTTAKDFIAAILERHLHAGSKNPGSLNFPQDMVRVLLKTRKSDAYCVTEISAHGGPGKLDLPLALVRPQIGVVTNIGSDHLSAYHNREAIADEKARLIRALPPDGIAILNADDALVLAMRSHFSGRCVTFGMSQEAMLRGEAVQSEWPQRLSLHATWKGETVLVQTQLCGTHWAPTVLAALATCVALEVPLALAAIVVAGIEPYEGRMQALEVDGITFIRDDWKAPLSTVEPAFEFMRNAKADRKIIVIGSISDYAGDDRRYAEIGRSALAIADNVVFVGPRASAALRAKHTPNDPLLAFPSMREASNYLTGYLKAGDLVLLKGSARADHLQRLILARTTGIDCWLPDCRRNQFCDSCELQHVPSETGPTIPEQITTGVELGSNGADSGSTRAAQALAADTLVVIGLGNPQQRLADTPHNVGYRAVELLAARMQQEWRVEGGRVMLACGELQGRAVCLVKPLTAMNECGPVLAQLARDLGFGVHQCILVHDDLDLPLGTVRTRLRGSDGGHRGVRSILNTFQDDTFRRVKLGVGKSVEGLSVSDYVLTPFTLAQQAVVESMSEIAADRITEWLRQGRTD
jgi:UDP-N-acetylmuramoyl-tripeptide--D-alanyl-D-alanine ligase